jgi:hypothetical protein
MEIIVSYYWFSFLSLAYWKNIWDVSLKNSHIMTFFSWFHSCFRLYLCVLKIFLKMIFHHFAIHIHFDHFILQMITQDFRSSHYYYLSFFSHSLSFHFHSYIFTIGIYQGSYALHSQLMACSKSKRKVFIIHCWNYY